MMECTTGLTDDEFDGLLAWLREEGVEGYPPILDLSGSLRATLMYLRQNIVQAVIGEILGVSQPTVSRAIIISPHGNDPEHTHNSLLQHATFRDLGCESVCFYQELTNTVREIILKQLANLCLFRSRVDLG